MDLITLEGMISFPKVRLPRPSIQNYIKATLICTP